MLMSSACKPLLVGMTSPVSEILLPSKMAKFPFPTMSMVIKKFNQSESAQEIYASIMLMSSACTPILVGMTSPVSEIMLPSKTAKFPFPTMVIKKFNQLESAQKIPASIN